MSPLPASPGTDADLTTPDASDAGMCGVGAGSPELESRLKWRSAVANTAASSPEGAGGSVWSERTDGLLPRPVDSEVAGVTAPGPVGPL